MRRLVVIIILVEISCWIGFSSITGIVWPDLRANAFWMIHRWVSPADRLMIFSPPSSLTIEILSGTACTFTSLCPYGYSVRPWGLWRVGYFNSSISGLVIVLSGIGTFSIVEMVFESSEWLCWLRPIDVDKNSKTDRKNRRIIILVNLFLW